MFLKALEIQGFKSFPDRTRITVGKGITAVVGPNGSGKSNISDAIRWVLGETSAKQLRGGGKMENVIFGGTQQRGAMGFASVSLVVDNTDRRIDVDNDEVTIGRKYYRSGDSEYSVNGQNVRLKDIYELFLDTGLGRDGYSVIGQGRIAEIVGAKSNERREIFEEASGIAKYRYRKNEAERRLASAEENLVRLRDILGELEERVGPLERESKKAKQYLELAERRKGLEVTLWVDTVQKARDTVREQQRKIEIAGADYARAGREIEAIDAETESTRAEIEHLITEADRCNAEIRAITEEIAGADSRIAVLASSLVTYDEKYANIVSSLLGRIVVVDDINEASRTARALDYRNRVVTVDGQVVNAGGSFTGGSVSRSAGLFSRKQEIDELKKKVEALEKQRDAAEEKTDRAKAEVDALSAELTATESEAITAGGDKIRGEVESGRIAAALSQARAAGEMLSAERAQLAAQIAASEKAGADAAAEMEVLTRDSAALEEELRAISGSDDTFLETRTRLADELSDLKLKALAAQKDIESHRAAIAQLESRTDESDARARQLAANIETLTAQNAERAAQIETIRAAIAGSRNEIEKREEAKAGAVRRRMEKEGGITQQTARVRKITDEREALGREIARLTEQKEQKDAEYEQTVAKLWEEYELTLSAAQELCVPFESGAELRRQVSEVRGKIKALGNVNVSAIEEYAEVSQRYEFLRAQVGDVETSKAELQKLIAGLSDEMRAMFSESFAAINRNFGRIFAELFGGGTARLYLEDEADVLGSGISIEVAPPGKIIRNLSALSGGEQALVAISIYFAIFGVNPAPFCVLDEIEAALDDVNVTRFAQYLRRISSETQFIVITHRRGTMEEADVLYGVTMQEDGVSKVLKLDLEHVDASLVS